jgi:hypothetical protein
MKGDAGRLGLHLTHAGLHTLFAIDVVRGACRRTPPKDSSMQQGEEERKQKMVSAYV